MTLKTQGERFMMFYGLKSAEPRGVTNILETGLTGNAVKTIGIILMVFDHLHQMFWVQGVPVWFYWLGRPVLPMFLFMCAEGFYHTRSRKAYLLRLFTCFVCMNAANTALTFALFNDDVMLINNVFGTMLLTGLYILFVRMLREGIEEKRAGRIIASALLILLPVLYSLIFAIALNSLPWQAIIALSFIPNLITTEGGIPAVILGVLFYLCRGKRLMQTLTLSAGGILSFITDSESCRVQWLMIFALIPVLLYNGRRGKGNKYFFYVFYPAHIYLFYIIAWAIQ
ncbi:MAG: conjugal transfer protein TraX [Synergistaceae bacterium]|jgi:hypothetical protein|nr:conjugal transfer protein TraX [Synergistaceae bacterium]